MKRLSKVFWSLVVLWAVVLLLCWQTPASAQTPPSVWYVVEKGQWKTLGWDAVTQLTDGDPIPPVAEAILSYNVYVKSFKTGSVISIGSGITATSLEIVLPQRGKYLTGVNAQLLYAGETIPKVSLISWSENPTVCLDGKTFGLQFQTGTKDPKGLK
jgi:hypothetical protein